MTSVIEKLREKIKHSIEEKVRKAHVKSKTGAAEFSGRSKSNSLQEGGATAEVRKSKLKRKTKLVLPGKGKAEAASPSAKLMKYQLPISPFKGRSLGFDALKRRGKESGYLRVKIGLISSLHLRAATFRRRWTWRTPLCVDCSFSEQNSGCVAS